MIAIVAQMKVKKESIEDFKKTAAPLIEASRNEEGNIEYALYQDLKDETVLTFIEKWKDSDAINFHNSTPHFTGTLPKLQEFLTQPPVISLYNPL